MILRALRINVIKVHILNYTFLKFLRILNSINFDLIYLFTVSTRDWLLFILTKLYSKYKRISIVYDYFISKFETFYDDRQLFAHKNVLFKGLKYIYLYYLDFLE